jgi:hypothetical protein
MAAMQAAAHAQAKPTGLAAHESLLTTLFFALLAAFVGLVVWEVIDGKKASRSSLDIAKLAAAAAKKQSAAGAPSGSLATLEPPPSTSRPFAPPPPPPPPRQQPAAEAPMEHVSPFAPPPREETANPFAAPPSEMIASPGSLDSTVAFNPSGADAGSSGGWADLLQRVRAGEPEAASFKEVSPPPLTEDESFSMPSAEAGPPAGLSPASSSEAWEALLKRTTTGEGQGPAAAGGSSKPAADVSKISLNSSFQLPGEGAPPAAPAASPFGIGAPPFGGGGEPGGGFGSSFEDSGATFPAVGSGASPFSLPGSGPPPAPEPALGSPMGMGFSFSSDPTSEPASPFSLTPPAGGAGGFDAPSFKLPGSSAPVDDFGGGGSGGFQLPSGGGGFGGGANPFDFGSAANENPSSSTLPLSDLFSKPGGGGSSPPAFQLPTGGGGGAPDFLGSAGMDSEAGNPNLGRTISLDFAKGGGQKPPPPLPKTEG